MALPAQLVTYYYVQVLYLWITSSYKYKAFLPQVLLFLDIFYPILFSERSSADVNIWMLSVLTDGGGCVNLLITSCTARLTLPTVLIDKRGDVSCAGWCPDCHATCTGGLAMSFLFLKSSHNMSNARQMYPYELVHGLADNFQTWHFPHNVSNVICFGYFDYRDWQRCYLLTIIFISW